jgi:hypothetical protein
VRQNQTKIEDLSRDSEETSNEAGFPLISTDGRHARIFTLSGWKWRPRNVILLVRSGGTTAPAVRAPATTMLIPLFVPRIAISISAVSILFLTVSAIYIPVTIPIPITVLWVLFTVTVSVSVTFTVAITVAATTATRATRAVSAWWRRTPIDSPHGRWRVLGPLTKKSEKNCHL